jgi:hypothetical protein
MRPTIKERAEELMIKFMRIDTEHKLTYAQHKENAIVVIDEVLTVLEDVCDGPYDYYKAIKKEIEKL